MTINNPRKSPQIREEIANRILGAYLPSLQAGIENVIQSSREHIKNDTDFGRVVTGLEHLISYLNNYDPTVNINYGRFDKCDREEAELRDMIAARRKEFKRGERAFRVLEPKYGIPAKTLCRAESKKGFLTYAKTLQVVEAYFKDEPERYTRAIELIDYLKKTYPERMGKPYHPKELEERITKS